ncbi:MAG: zinc dependent phospholipase C family protein [Bacilli bacterium]|nr:zinc dependent phospholipase C family protein [Bacilli bacterium]
MPSIITHHIFAEEVLKKTNISNKINKELYQTFAQSHDYLFYYAFDLKNSKQIKELGHHAHKNKSQEYLLNIIKNIKKNKLQNNDEALSYLYGSITHYVLDSTCHPFIFYKTGAYHKDDPSTFKYKGLHTQMERDIDAIYYEKYYNKKINKCNIAKEIINLPNFSNSLIELISKTYKDTFNKDNIGTFYIKAIKQSRFIHKLISNDRFGIKKIFYKIIDKVSNKKFGNITAYSTYNLKPNSNYLNNKKKTWNNPCHKNLKYNYSFDELFELSINKCLDIFNKIDSFFNDRTSIDELKETIPNLSYINGLPLEEYTTMKYYEF